MFKSNALNDISILMCWLNKMPGGCVAFQSGCDLLHIEIHITASFEERYDSLDSNQIIEIGPK